MQKGLGIGSEDTVLRTKLLDMQRELNKPDQYRGRLHELMPKMNNYVQTAKQAPLSDTLVDGDNLAAVKKFLEMQTEGLENLIKILRKDMKDMEYIASKVRMVPDKDPKQLGSSLHAMKLK